MPQRYDVIVAGLGVMGSSVALHAARRGLRVLGLDRLSPPHTLGSSHGNTRLIREGYYEHPLYVPLVRRSYELLRAMAEDLDQDLVTRTGSLMLGHPESGLVQGTIRSVAEHAVPHRFMSAEEVHREFPGLEPFDEYVGVYEPGSSLLNPEMIVAGQLSLATAAGAELLYERPLVSWKAIDDGVIVSVSDSTYWCRQLVLAAGAWNAKLAPRAFGMLQVERQLQQWWVPARNPEWFSARNLPVTMWQLPDARIFYTMPDTGLGLKVGWHHSGATVDPDSVGREAEPAENAELADLLRRFLPAAKGIRRASAVCLYTNTPDGHFLVDRHPDEKSVWLLSPCSGHGFKFAGVLGEIMAGLLTDTPTGFDLSPFQFERFRR